MQHRLASGSVIGALTKIKACSASCILHSKASAAKAELFHHKYLISLNSPPDSKSPAARRAGSIPAPGTTNKSGRVQTLPDFFISPLKTAHALSTLFQTNPPASASFGGTFGGTNSQIGGTFICPQGSTRAGGVLGQ